MKDLYLVINLNLINLHVKSAALFMKSVALFIFPCAFHFLLCFSLFSMLFTEKHCAFHFSLCFSLKSTALFTFCCAFHFLLRFSLKSTALFTFHCTFQWKAQKQLIQHRSLSLIWSFIEYRGRYILLVMKSAALFIRKTILQGIVTPMFTGFSLSVTSWDLVSHIAGSLTGSTPGFSLDYWPHTLRNQQVVCRHFLLEPLYF